MENFSEWLNEDLNALTKSTKELPSKTDRESNSRSVPEISKLSSSVNPIKRTYTAKAEVSGSHGEIYHPAIQFQHLDFETIKPNHQLELGEFSVKDKDGIYKFNRPKSIGTHVKVSCDCEDFQRVFQEPNETFEALFNKKTNADHKKTANPHGKAGMCKHLFKLKQELQDRGILGANRF